MERRRERGPHIPRWQNVPLAMLAMRLKNQAKDGKSALEENVTLFRPATMIGWHSASRVSRRSVGSSRYGDFDSWEITPTDTGILFHLVWDNEYPRQRLRWIHEGLLYTVYGYNLALDQLDLTAIARSMLTEVAF